MNKKISIKLSVTVFLFSFTMQVNSLQKSLNDFTASLKQLSGALTGANQQPVNRDPAQRNQQPNIIQPSAGQPLKNQPSLVNPPAVPQIAIPVQPRMVAPQEIIQPPSTQPNLVLQQGPTSQQIQPVQIPQQFVQVGAWQDPYKQQLNQLVTRFMGTSEDQLRAQIPNYVSGNANIDKVRFPQETKNAIMQGIHGFYTVGYLYNQINWNRAPGGGKLRIFFARSGDDLMTDVLYLQSHPANKGALFQVASTFFAPLEGGIIHKDAKIVDMIPHAVQGEYASLGTLGATIRTKYFTPTYNASPVAWPQITSPKLSINPENNYAFRYYYLLQNLGSRAAVFWPSSKTRDGIQNVLPVIDRNVLFSYVYSPQDPWNVGIYLKQNVVVCIGRGDNGQPFIMPLDSTKWQTVSQVFTSAVNLRRYINTNYNPNMLEFASMALTAAYKGTIYAAGATNTKKVYLTLVGGGAFANPINFIGAAIIGVIPDIQRLGLDVTLIYRPDKHRPGLDLRNASSDYQFLASILSALHGNKINSQMLQTVSNYTQAAYNRNAQAQLLYANQLNNLFYNLP